MTQQPNQDQIDVYVGSMLLGIVKPLLDSGVSPSSALRFVSVMLIENAFGPAIFDELGVPQRTWMRWRAEVREHMANRPELAEDPPAEFVTAVAEAIKQHTNDSPTQEGQR